METTEKNELRNQLVKYLDLTGCTEKADKDTRTKFLEIAGSFGLNPFKREIHLVPFGDKFNIIVGYESYIKRGNQTGLNKGWKTWTEGEIKAVEKKVTRKKKDGGTYEKTIITWEGDLKAITEITVAGWDIPFHWEVDFSEFNAENEQWAKSPKFMIKKVCTAQAFRLCFSEAMAGLPYTEEEVQVIQTQEAKKDEFSELRIEANGLVSTSTLKPKQKEYSLGKIKEAEEEELHKIISYLKENQIQEVKAEPVKEQAKFSAELPLNTDTDDGH